MCLLFFFISAEIWGLWRDLRDGWANSTRLKSQTAMIVTIGDVLAVVLLASVSVLGSPSRWKYIQEIIVRLVEVVTILYTVLLRVPPKKDVVTLIPDFFSKRHKFLFFIHVSIGATFEVLQLFNHLLILLFRQPRTPPPPPYCIRFLGTVLQQAALNRIQGNYRKPVSIYEAKLWHRDSRVKIPIPKFHLMKNI